jgi:hypothetical protein
VAQLIVDYFAYAAHPGASTCCTARHAARRRLLHLRRASRCPGTSRASLSTFRLCRVAWCLGTSRGSSSTSSPTPRIQVPRHLAWLIARLVAPLVVDYFAYTARPGASTCRVARHAARRRLLRLRRASGCLGTSRGSSRGSSRRSSSTTSLTLCVRVPRHVARLIVDFFAYATRPGAWARRATRRRLLRLHRASRSLGTSHGSSRGSSRRSSSTTSPKPRVSGASARRTARDAVRRRLLRLRRASGCLDMSRGSSRGSSRRSSSTSSHTSRISVPRHVARLVVDFFAYAARPGASARRATRRRLLRLRRASGCLGTSHGSSRGSSRRSSSTTSPTPRVRVPRHIARLVTRLVADYFDYAAHLGASARCAARHAARRAARRRLLRLRRVSGCLGTSCGSLSTSSPTPRVRVPRHIARLVVDFFAYAARPGASARRAARHAISRRLLRVHHAFGCLDTSRGSLRRSSSTTSPCAGPSSTTSPTPRVQVPRHVARLVSLLVVDYFTYAAHPGASARRAARHAARCRLLRAP